MAINVSKWSSHSKLSKALSTEATEIYVRFGEGLRFRVPETDYFYATIRSHGKYEHVKVLAVKGDVLHVVRGQDNTQAQTWAESRAAMRVLSPMCSRHSADHGGCWCVLFGLQHLHHDRRGW